MKSSSILTTPWGRDAPQHDDTRAEEERGREASQGAVIPHDPKCQGPGKSSSVKQAPPSDG